MKFVCPLLKMKRRRVSPHPSPQWGGVAVPRRSVFSMLLSGFADVTASPTSYINHKEKGTRTTGLARPIGTCSPSSPTRHEFPRRNEFSTTGKRTKWHSCPLRRGRGKRERVALPRRRRLGRLTGRLPDRLPAPHTPQARRAVRLPQRSKTSADGFVPHRRGQWPLGPQSGARPRLSGVGYGLNSPCRRMKRCAAN